MVFLLQVSQLSNSSWARSLAEEGYRHIKEQAGVWEGAGGGHEIAVGR